MNFTILIADDHGLVRAGLKALLNGERHFQVIGEATDCEETLRRCLQLKPDIVLMDLSMPGLGGIETTREILRRMPSVRVLIVTMHEDPALLGEAIRIWAAGFIIKRALESELMNALHAVSRGDLYIHPTMTRAFILEKDVQGSFNGETDALTPRELDVLRLIVQGYTNRQMAGTLNLSIRTVESHRFQPDGQAGLFQPGGAGAIRRQAWSHPCRILGALFAKTRAPVNEQFQSALNEIRRQSD